MKNIITLGLSILLVSCSTTTVSLNENAKASPMVGFVDIDKFDRDLTASLVEPLEVVNVSFYEKISPNAIPQRIQKWISATEKNGGRVTIQPPPNELAPKNPMALFGLFGSLFNTVKSVIDAQGDPRLEKVKGHDAVILLERNKQGEVVVGTVKFVKRPNL
jgi:hypothetical protein